MKRVSVHIVTFNSEAYIDSCLEAVFRQSYPIHSIIVVDNDSKDSTKEKLQKYNNIIIIENKHNGGFAAGHNQALRMSDCEYCLILNPDVILHPDYVYALVNRLENNKQFGSATGKLLFKQSPDYIDSTGLVMNKARRAFDRGAGDINGKWEYSGEVFGVSGAAALYTKRMVESISIDGCFFDEDFFAYKEDVDVAWRGQLFGWKAYYCSDAIAYHDRGWKKGGRSQISLFVRKLSYINRYKMIIKNDKPSKIVRHFFPFIIYEIGSLFYFLLKEPKVLASWLDFYRKLPDLTRKRKFIQNNIAADLTDIYRYFK
ncbi:glycosyltransferase family 2 protein [Paenibacillus vulneris]|uniref:Glycosyltransferase family 2 protein n=1 Tax=Paenibacillus vulneris TaxID=1133364 RepID=A0ABW3UG57_9BACL